MIHRRDFLLSLISLFLSGCVPKNERFPSIPNLADFGNYSNLSFPEELDNFKISRSKVETIFSNIKTENPILIIARNELSILQEELNKLSSEKTKLNGKIIFENILTRFFNILEIYLYGYDLYQNKNSYFFEIKRTKSSELRPIILLPGSILRYSFRGYCMNRNLGAPGSGDTLIIHHVKDLRINDKIKKILMCVINNYDKFSNPQGIVWFLIELENQDFISNYQYIETEMMRISTICPEARYLYEEFKRKKIIIDIIRRVPLPKIKIGNIEYSLHQIFTDPEVTNKMLRDLINQGYQTPGPTEPGYSVILPNVFTEAIGNGTLSASVRIINFNPYSVAIDLRELYAKPVAQKQRISFPYELYDISIFYPYLSLTDLQKILNLLCKSISFLSSFFFEERFIRVFNPIHRIYFFYQLSKFIVGYDFLRCQKLDCNERLNILFDDILLSKVRIRSRSSNDRSGSGKITHSNLDNFKGTFRDFIQYSFEQIMTEKLSSAFCPEQTAELTKKGIFYEIGNRTDELCNRYNFTSKYFNILDRIIKC